ncbi:LysR family transcriptional regulator [Pseudomonas sp. CHM02]|uniref:LysR family transcriptional regulator n=1 Tax=Pseudomonas sp. CHM02 TaxID=1463662 RepID=UPI000471C2C2|nr:LysR family transcriptional regulator [Pseudomonas sp. CHM02]
MNDDCKYLTQIDLNLLLVLFIIHESLSVSVAAKRLGVGQPAVSNSLKKLRCLFDDPLFLR